MDLAFASVVGVPIVGAANCEAQFSLTRAGSVYWMAHLPAATQNEVFYYRTIHELPDNFWQAITQPGRWSCGIGSLLIPGSDDGVVGIGEGLLLFGNDMGITEGQCHTAAGGRFDQRDDENRNDIMDEMGRVSGTWTQWLNRDGPGNSGDWEHRGGHAGVCANPIDYQARRAGDCTAANLTGEVFSSNSPEGGLVCLNSDQPDNACFDYEVRFLCP